jgi:hypothetical protein
MPGGSIIYSHAGNLNQYMKRSFFTLLFISASSFAIAQLDAIKPKEKTAKVNKPKPVKRVKPVNTGSYIIVYRGEQLAAAFNNYNIFVDGRKVCALSNGKFFKYPVAPGKHEVEAKKAGVNLTKKETFTSVVSSPGRNNYIVFNVKKTLLREKFVLNEVVQNSGRQAVNNLKEDNCQGDIGNK